MSNVCILPSRLYRRTQLDYSYICARELHRGLSKLLSSSVIAWFRVESVFVVATHHKPCSDDLGAGVARLINVEHADVVVFGLCLRLRVDLGRIK